MNAITNSSVVSFYPRLAYANESLVVDGYDVPEPNPYSFTISPSNSGWTKPCGLYCPMLRRITFGDQGVATYPWSHRPKESRPTTAWGAPSWSSSSASNNPLVNVRNWGERYSRATRGWRREPSPVRTTDLRLQEPLRWRMSTTCSNPHCSHNVLAEERALYLGPYL